MKDHVRLARTDAKRAREISESLYRCSTDRGDIPPALHELQRLLGACDGGAYRLKWHDRHFDLDWFLASEPRSQLPTACARALVHQQSGRLAYYDPLRPEPRQRNVVFTKRELELPERDRPQLQEGIRLAGLGGADQLRVLVCDRSTLLAWVGFYRQEAFSSRERALLSAVVPALQTRFRFERQMDRAHALEAALDAALEALGSPAFLLDAAGRLVHANSLGRQASIPLAQLRSQSASPPESYELFDIRIPGAADHRLVVATTPRAALGPRHAAMSQRWKLTPKQSLVLFGVLRGKSNKQIAEELRCVEGTVELHITAILKKSGAESRTALLARFWSET